MNKKEAIQIICLLDECIDHAQQPETMLAVDALRRLLLRLLEHSCCEVADGQALLQEAAGLPALCISMELHPSLPMRLCRMTYSLCAPELTQGKAIGLQCREQAEKIRCLRWWGQHMSALFACWDVQCIQELQCLHAEKLKMMECAFARFLTIWRADAARRTIMDRSVRLQEIAELREKLSLENIADAIVRCDTDRARSREKLSEFEAEISAADFFDIVKTNHQPHSEPLFRSASSAKNNMMESCDA